MFKMIIEAITAVATAVGQALGLVSKRSDLKNAADVKAAVQSKDEAAQVALDAQAVADKNLEEMRKRIS